MENLFDLKCSHGKLPSLCEYKVNFFFMYVAKTNLFMNAVTTNMLNFPWLHPWRINLFWNESTEDWHVRQIFCSLHRTFVKGR